MIFASLRSKSLDFFNVPFRAESFEDAENQVRTGILAQRDLGLLVNAEDLILAEVGSWDPKNGVFAAPDPDHVCQVIQIPGVAAALADLHAPKEVQTHENS